MLQLLVLLATFGSFTAAASLDYDIEGSFYVVDRERNLLVKYSAAGDSLGAVSGQGTGALQFDEPVAVFARGLDIYVADHYNHRIQRFDRQLDYVATVRTRDDADERARFGFPRDVAVSRQGEMMIVDGENRRVVKIDAFGRFERSFGDIRAGAGRLADPIQVEVDRSDNVYVVDGRRLVVFDPFGSYLRDFEPPLEGAIRTLSIDRDTLVVSDSVDVLVYDLAGSRLVDRFQLLAPASAVRLVGGRIVAAEPKRVTVSRFVPPPDPSGSDAGDDE